MKPITAILLCGLLSAAAAPWAQAQKADDSAEKAIAALENQWLESEKTNNPDLVAPLLADKFVSTGADGKVSNKEQALADARKRKWSSVDYEDVHVRVFGNTAIAIGKYKGKGTEGSKTFDETQQWTDTWVKMPNGKWLCVADHSSDIAKDEKK